MALLFISRRSLRHLPPTRKSLIESTRPGITYLSLTHHSVNPVCCINRIQTDNGSRQFTGSTSGHVALCHNGSAQLSGRSSVQAPLLHKSTVQFTGRIPGSVPFHTSPPRPVNPLAWLIVKPIAKAVSIITGRFLRKRWSKLSDDDKSSWKKRVWRHRGKLILGGCALVLAGIIDYFTHIQEAPIIKRKRYIAFTQEQLLKIVGFELQMHLEEYKDKMVPTTHPVYSIIVKIANNIIRANQDLDIMRNQTWQVVVVNDDQVNAFVLPSGHIFVFTGLLKLTQNEDQLAVILGHEMAHAVLSHAAEQISFSQLLDKLVIVLMAGIWFFMPTDGIAVVTQWFYNKVVQLFLHLPYSRKLEAEADEVGLQLIAKACYDVRESSNFWASMAIKSALDDQDVSPEWLSTHPAHDNRAVTLDLLMTKAMTMREQCNCARLPAKDPRDQIPELMKLLEEKVANSQQNTEVQPAPVTPTPVAPATPS